MRRAGNVPGRFKKLTNRLRCYKVPYKIIFFITGIASTLWFLVRVIPKPSRAGYPCMRAAAPLMSSFVVYLLSVTGSAMLFKRSRQFFRRARYIMAAVAFVGALVLFAFSSNLFPEKAVAAENKADPSDFPPNQPMGEERGIFPGRVVWEWNPDATDENCTNTFNDPVRGEDGYFLAKNSDQEVINEMMANVVMKLTGTYDVGTAWERLFVDFNKRKGRGEGSYEDGQKIFIKFNMGTGGWLTNNDLTRQTNPWNLSNYGIAETSPAMVISVLDQLVNDVGIPQENIYVGDPIAHIFQDVYEQIVALFPDVKYVDKSHSDLGRTRIYEASEPAIVWSDKGDVMPNAGFDYLYTEMENADYLINLAALKAHARAGVTLTAKNHFGSHTRDAADHLHTGLVSRDNDNPYRTEYGMYRVLTDIMGHEKLGGNTVLFIIEGLWGGPEATEKPVKWDSAPFNGDWPNSILGAQDAVALESVCFDLLKTEFNDPSAIGKDRPWYGAVDDHLHQAADSRNWPEGFIYDPEGDGTPMGSMGVHEHWNNEMDKQYSRNLGYDYGIELVADKSLVKTTVSALEAGTVPLIDGDAADDCWDAAQWYYIDETWINWGEEIDSSDYFGRFKVSWSEAENLVYFFVEITDDAFVDGYVYPDTDYPDFDIVEVFLDEDMSGGLHVFDDNPTLGQNSENAFSYHIAVDAPADGGTSSAFHACDIDGTDWPAVIMDYAGHIPELTMKRSGNRYLYEFSMKVFNDTYDDANPEASRVVLTNGKEMGMSLAYCDNDTPGTARDNFFGSVWVPEEEYNDHWMNADGYGRVRLIKEGEDINHAVEVTGSIADFEVTQLNTDLVVHDNLLDVFNDPDGDLLTYTVNCDEANLTFSVAGNVLKVNASAEFTGEVDVTVVASDGEFEASAAFKVTANIVGIPERGRSARLSCYPNPFTDLLSLDVHLESGYTGPFVVQVYNMAGMNVLTLASGRLKGGNGTLTVDMGGEPRGYYILKVEAGGETHTMVLHKH
jgi:hypothetical protein